MSEPLELEVVGLNYRVTPGTLIKMERETPLRCKLEREPKNPHDKDAVKVMVVQRPWGGHGAGEGMHIGYLRRQVAQVVAPQLDNGKFGFTDVYLIGIDVDHGQGKLLLKKPAKARK